MIRRKPTTIVIKSGAGNDETEERHGDPTHDDENGEAMLQLFREDGTPREGAWASKSQVHAQGLLYGSAVVWIYIGDRVLLQRRSLSKKSDPGKWSASARGHIDYRESPEECARRETEEELGLVLEGRLNPLGRFREILEDASGYIVNHHCWTYSIRLPETVLGSLRLCEEEVMDADVFVPAYTDADGISFLHEKDGLYARVDVPCREHLKILRQVMLTEKAPCEHERIRSRPSEEIRSQSSMIRNP